MVDPYDDEDINIELSTPLGFALAQFRLVSYSQTLLSILLPEQTLHLICFADVDQLE